MSLPEEITMSKPNFDAMSRDELAHYMVSHRDTPEGVEARQAFIRQMAKRAESHGIDFYRLRSQDASHPSDQISSIMSAPIIKL
jgi:hypothetical protein